MYGEYLTNTAGPANSSSTSREPSRLGLDAASLAAPAAMVAVRSRFSPPMSRSASNTTVYLPVD